MDWIEEAAVRLKRRNQLLFTKDSAYLQDLRGLFRGQDHRVMALWAFDLAEESAAWLAARHPEDPRPRAALASARDWAAGRAGMRQAQRRILDCHAMARDLCRPEEIAVCHAVGQACAVVHTAGHAIGYSIYDLTAIVYGLGIQRCAEAVARRKRDYIDRLFHWRAHRDDVPGAWAPFMMKTGPEGE